MATKKIVRINEWTSAIYLLLLAVCRTPSCIYKYKLYAVGRVVFVSLYVSEPFYAEYSSAKES